MPGGRPRKPTWPPLPRRRKGTGSLQRLADGSLRARLPAALDPGRRAREFAPGALSEAEAWLDAHLHPQKADLTTMTLGEWAGQWWVTFVEPISAPNTARHYLYLLQQLEPLSAMLLTDVRPSMIQAIASSYSQRVGAATAHQAAGVWKRCLEAAVDDELLTRNPARRIVLPKSPPRQPRRHVTPKEAQALLTAIIGHRFEAAYALLLGCGLRLGEALGLAWADVDFAQHRIWISRQWTGSSWRELPKAKNPHWVRLPSPVEAALIRHRDRQPPGCTLVMQSPFLRKKTRAIQPWSAFVVRTDLEVIVSELGFAHLTPHAARRGFVTVLLDGGASPAAIAQLAGHTDAATTLKYAMPSEDGQRRAAQIVDGYLSGEASDGVSGTETDPSGQH